MPNSCSRSAGIVFVDREQVLDEARALARGLRALHPEVRRIILFGSFARGRGGPRSDLDLLLVVEDTPLEPRERAAHYLPVSRRPIDMFVYTEAELELRDRPPVLREALVHGIDLLEP